MAASWIDLRSDTVTRPTPAMRKAMAEAEVGDDVLGDDPTVQKLESKIAGLLGKEAALYAPSGTMTNQIAIRVHTRPGDELICETGAHVFRYEGGAPAMLSGVTCKTLVAPHGVLDVSHFEGQANSPSNIHLPKTRLVVIENTHNRGGGAITPLANVQRIAQWAGTNSLIMHLDGARLFNLVVATGIGAPEWAKHFESVSVCFSKGLGAPIGSALVGPKDFIQEARRVRKVFGGGMRQVGILAAACIHALDHHVDRLAEDHQHAQLLAKALEESGRFDVHAAEVETNILWIPVDPKLGTAEQVAQRFREFGIIVQASGPQLMRMVTHLDLTRAGVDRVIDAIHKIAKG